jgi:two-component system LytT family response regulator
MQWTAMHRTPLLKTVKTVIVDDEPLGRERIRTLLADDPEIEVVGEACDGRSAVTSIMKSKPDLLFLDVQMPEMSGFEVLEAVVGDKMPVVIFVTAYDHYAVKAFQVHALDYLLKSFDRERFSQAVQRAKAEIARGREHKFDERLVALLEDIQEQHGKPERLIVRSGGRIIFLRVEEIDWIEAADNYVCLHVGRESHLTRGTMASIEGRLDARKFLRIHRSTIVNLDRVRELAPLFHGDYAVRLRDGTELVLSRNYREKLQEPLGQFL